MKKNVKIDCYVEEYCNTQNQLCARIRDKKTNKKVCMCGEIYDKIHFLRFLSQCKINNQIMPTIYQRNGSDVIAVRGTLVSESDDEIVVCIDNGGYLFE